MLFGNKAMITRECNHQNTIRRVCSGSTDHAAFFRNIRGDLLISGYVADNITFLADMITAYMRRDDLPTIVLSGHPELFTLLRQRRRAGEIDRVMLSDPVERNYHSFYGMNPQQMIHMIHLTAQSLGYNHSMDRVLQYASAALNIVAATYPVSLPALVELLRRDDDDISDYALRIGLSNVIADIIRANHEAGIILRRTCEVLVQIFDDVSSSECDTRYNFQSGAMGNVAVMAFYCVSTNQKLMNAYLKQELFFTLKRAPKIRLVADEMDFDRSEEDELLQFLFHMKRQGKIELVFVSKNAVESSCGMQMNFSNVVLSGHDEPAVTEELSKTLWGTYLYHYPNTVAGRPPALLFSFRRTIHWQIATEERLRVRAVDLYPSQGLFTRGSDLLAIKTSANSNIYLVESSRFFRPEPNLSMFAVGSS